MEAGEECNMRYRSGLVADSANPEATREEILEMVEIARIKALPLAKIEGGGAAFRAILALADSVAALAELVEVRKTFPLPPPDNDAVVIERRQNPEGRRHTYDRRQQPCRYSLTDWK